VKEVEVKREEKEGREGRWNPRKVRPTEGCKEGRKERKGG
jgi:hypothetical protein